jgi:hypothetical protein
MTVGSRDKLRNRLRTRLSLRPWQRLWAWLRGWHRGRRRFCPGLELLGFGLREQKDIGFESDLLRNYGFPIPYAIIGTVRSIPRRQTEVALTNEFHNLMT